MSQEDGGNSQPALSESHVFHRSFSEAPHLAVSARGSTITLADGREILDACGGAGVSCVGQGRPDVIAAVTAQMQGGAGYVHTGTYTTAPAEELASLLLSMGKAGEGHDEKSGEKIGEGATNKTLPSHGLERVFFVSSGSEAMEAALKLARQYWWERGQGERRVNFISRRQSYHGSTIGAMSVSSNLARKLPYANFLSDKFNFVRPAYTRHYHDSAACAIDKITGTLSESAPSADPLDMRTLTTDQEDAFARSLADELDAAILALGPDTVMAFVMEPVVGATSGCVPPPRGYLRLVREVCDRHGILLILDEVMCGAGRTGTYWAFEHEGPGLKPDIVTMGKGLGGGYAPIAACIAGHKVVEAIRPADGPRRENGGGGGAIVAGTGAGSFVHGHTYQAHPLACAAALAVTRAIQREKLVARCAEMGKVLESELKSTLAGRPYVGDVRGRGLFWAVEFFDVAARRPFPPHRRVGPRVQEAVFDLHSIAIYPGTGTVDGRAGDHVLLAPAYIVTRDEIARIVAALADACDAVFGHVGGSEPAPRKGTPQQVQWRLNGGAGQVPVDPATATGAA